MMYDDLLRIMETFPYKDGKIGTWSRLGPNLWVDICEQALKNQRCASQPSHMTKPNVAVVVSNWRKRSLTELKDTASRVERSLNTLSPKSILSPRSSLTMSRTRTPSPQSRTSPGRVQFSDESSRRSSYKAFFRQSRRRSARGGPQTPSPRSPRSPRSPVPPVPHARCVSQPAHLSKSNLETLGEINSL